jgi:XTP/dITP diphosphohydrolase
MITLVIATRNAHKVEEIRSILGDRFEYRTLNDFPDAPAVIEDAPTFSGNAAKKAVALAAWLAERAGGSPEAGEVLVLADDSGLEVDALGGAPGVHSARFAAADTGGSENSSSAQNNAKLLRLLEAVPPERRTGRFRCLLALAPVVVPGRRSASPVCEAREEELRTELFEGACEGTLTPGPRGEGGFGYDPLFVPDGYEGTFGELGAEVKNRLSHRARALEKAREWLERRGR